MHESAGAPRIADQVLGERTHLVIPSLPHWIEPTIEYLRQKAILCGACQESRAGKLLVALLEAVSNAVVHGNLQLGSELKEHGDDSFARALAERAADPILSNRVVDIQVEYDGARCLWTITDEGCGFDVDRVMARCLSDDPEVMLASGRGILMMHSFLDEIRYDLGGRRLTMTLKQPSGAEKRRETRVPLHRPFRVAPSKPDGSPDLSAESAAVSRDFSQHGVALLQEGLMQGQRIFVGIPCGRETVYVPASVRHCETIASGCVQLGCEFEVAPPRDAAGAEQVGRMHEAILEVLAHYQAPALLADERRAHPRMVFNKTVALVLEGCGEITGYARDLSNGGMALIAAVPVPLAGAVVALPRNDGPPVRIAAHVIRCNKIEQGLYDVGLRFLKLAAAGG
jgi:anti-sigma regulatory factor (Ser/Thr protein kinase)